VVVQNLRQVCVFKVSKEHKKPWLWWDYVTDFAIRCPMKEKKYTKECADGVIKSLGMLYCICFSMFYGKVQILSFYTELAYNLQALIIRQ
jgi:hypothetical protein